MRELSKEDGSSTLELAIVGGVFIMLLTVSIAGGRIALAGQSVEVAAAEAARQASLARSEGAARNQALHVARRILNEQGLACSDVSINVDTTQFGRTIGREASVTASVDCKVNLRDVAVPGLPGSRTVSATARSAIDTYRGRE